MRKRSNLNKLSNLNFNVDLNNKKGYINKMKNKKIKIREDVVEEVYMRLENVMDWYKEGGGGEFSDDWSVEEEKEIMKRFLGK